MSAYVRLVGNQKEIWLRKGTNKILGVNDGGPGLLTGGAHLPVIELSQGNPEKRI